jgi:UDP-glucose:(heptosyl)LPS alpha-1,3-glucosyltransferase
MGLATPGSEVAIADALPRPLRIALVLERSGPGLGGVENVAWEVAHGLVQAGDDVTLVTRSGTAPPGVALRRVETPGGWQPLRILAFSRAAARATRTGFDLVQSFSRTLHQDVFRAGGGSHAHYLERCHGPLSARLRRLSPRHATQLWIEGRVFADPSQTILCNSILVRDQIAQRYGVPAARLVVIRNGVDLARFHPARREHEGVRLRAELHAETRTVWLFVGSGFRRKGLDVAMGALAAGRDRDSLLWIAGRDDPAPWQRLAETLAIGPRVRFLGPRRDVEALYAAADGLLLPTRYDAFANVCLEAAAAGIPVVTSGANGAAEIAREGGLVVNDPEDVIGFAQALDALSEPAARATHGKSARALAEQHGWDVHIRALRALYARRLA